MNQEFRQNLKCWRSDMNFLPMQELHMKSLFWIPSCFRLYAMSTCTYSKMAEKKLSGLALLHQDSHSLIILFKHSRDRQRVSEFWVKLAFVFLKVYCRERVDFVSLIQETPDFGNNLIWCCFSIIFPRLRCVHIYFFGN